MITVIEVLGGLALFLYGVQSLSEAMEKLAGDQIHIWLDKVTSNRFKASIFGMIATALLQSSGLLMVTMIGLINANIMTLGQAVGVMLGQEIGTTLTAQLVSFDISILAYLFIAVGFIFVEFISGRRWLTYGEVLIGLGILFFGMNIMSGALKTVTEMPFMLEALTTMGQRPLAGLVAGAVATALVQSSSAVTALVVAMGASGVISLDGAISLLLGANIGSCITGFMASLKLSQTSRQASTAQILINVIGVLLFLPILSPFADLVAQTSDSLARQIANAHTIFNIAVSAAIFPFVPQITKLSKIIVRDLPVDVQEPERLTAFIDENLYGIPALAISEARKELVRIGRRASDLVGISAQALIEEDPELIDQVLDAEQNFLDPLVDIMEDFIDSLMQQENLSAEQQNRCFLLKSLLVDIERIGDLSENIAQAANEKVKYDICFSDLAVEEFKKLAAHVHRTTILAIDAFEQDDKEKAQKVCDLESDFDQEYYAARQQHIERMEKGICTAEGNVLYTETIRNLERISDHADNIGVGIRRFHSAEEASVAV